MKHFPNAQDLKVTATVNHKDFLESHWIASVAAGDKTPIRTSQCCSKNAALSELHALIRQERCVEGGENMSELDRATFLGTERLKWEAADQPKFVREGCAKPECADRQVE